MLFEKTSTMKEEGFKGFETVSSMIKNECKNVTPQKGIYFVLFLEDQHEFLQESVGGHFKGKNPTISINELNNNWVNNIPVIYIGQAGGGPKSKATLKKRLSQLIDFGNGYAVGHWGGRLMWQIKNNRKLKVCWLPTLEQDPKDVEQYLISQFKTKYGKRPFANLQG